MNKMIKAVLLSFLAMLGLALALLGFFWLFEATNGWSGAIAVVLVVWMSVYYIIRDMLDD